MSLGSKFATFRWLCTCVLPQCIAVALPAIRLLTVNHCLHPTSSTLISVWPCCTWRRPPGRPRNVWLNKVQEDANALLLYAVEIWDRQGAAQRSTRTTRRRLPSIFGLTIFFSAFTLLVGWQEGHPACMKSHSSHLPMVLPRGPSGHLTALSGVISAKQIS